MKKRWIVYGRSHPAFTTEVLGRYRLWFVAQLAAWHFRFWTFGMDSFADAWVVKDEIAALPAARVHR